MAVRGALLGGIDNRGRDLTGGEVMIELIQSGEGEVGTRTQSIVLLLSFIHCEIGQKDRAS